MGIFNEKSTFRKFVSAIDDAFMGRIEIDDSFYDDVEEALVIGDVGIDTADNIIQEWKNRINFHRARKPDAMKALLVETIEKVMDKGDRNDMSEEYPLIILMIGINGGGKTTSIAKLAHKYVNEGKTVLLAAADTFRAAAADQLEEWGNRVGIRTIRHEEGTDPSAVIYDSIQSAKANDIDVLICDTAGRLQTKANLMKELEKMDRIINREYPEASRETLLVLDATTGKNAISQAEEFSNISEITGIILTKLDGTARGGISITLADQFDLPIKFIGMGEGLDDLLKFDAKQFAEDIFADVEDAELPEEEIADAEDAELPEEEIADADDEELPEEEVADADDAELPEEEVADTDDTEHHESDNLEPEEIAIEEATEIEDTEAPEEELTETDDEEPAEETDESTIEQEDTESDQPEEKPGFFKRLFG